MNVWSLWHHAHWPIVIVTWMKLIIAESRNRTPRFRVVPDIILLLLLDLPLELLLGLLEGLDDTFARNL